MAWQTASKQPTALSMLQYRGLARTVCAVVEAVIGSVRSYVFEKFLYVVRVVILRTVVCCRQLRVFSCVTSVQIYSVKSCADVYASFI